MGNILVVDDEKSFRSIIRKTLEIAGHEVVEAGNGNEALKIYSKDQTDVVIIDIMMPEKEGIETIMELRRDYPKTNIIAMSGHGLNSPYLLMAKHLGANYILDKPFYVEELIKILDEILKK